MDYASQDGHQQGAAQPYPFPAGPGNPQGNAPPASPSTFRLTGGGSGKKRRRGEEQSESSSDDASSESEEEEPVGGDTDAASGKRGRGKGGDTGSGGRRREKRRRRREREEKSRNRVRDEAGVRGKCMDPDFCFRTLDDVYVRGRTKDDGKPQRPTPPRTILTGSSHQPTQQTNHRRYTQVPPRSSHSRRSRPSQARGNLCSPTDSNRTLCLRP